MQRTMKKILYSSFAVLFAATILASCNKEVNNVEPQDEDIVEFTIIAGNPSPEAETKTEIYSGSPYWSPGDAIGVTNGENNGTNSKFTTSIVSRATTASFTGSSAVSGDLYAYYPHQGLGVATNGVKVEIPVNQKPASGSFDGAADIMFSQAFTVSPANATVSDLKFARAGAIVKVVFKDNTTGSVITGQHPNIVSLTSTANLVGRVYLNVKGQSIGELYYGGSNTVNANYSPSTQFAINGTDGAYIIVYPQTLEAGTDNFTVTANTEAYAISKTISIPAGGIQLAPGKITTLNISIADANIAADPALTLPFADDFTWQDASAIDGTELSFSSSPAIPSAKYASFDKVYTTTTAGEVKFGGSSSTGYLTTKGINLSAASHISVTAKQFGSDVNKITISVDGGDPITAANDAGNLGGSYKTYVFNIPASSAKSKVTIQTSSKRAYVNNISIETGAYVPPTYKELPYSNTLVSGHDSFTITDVSLGSLTAVWKDSSYGMTANGQSTTSDIESYLVSPEINLDGVTAANLTFDHSINYFADVATAKTQTALQIKVGDGAWTAISIPYYPAALGNSFFTTPVDLDAYVGNVIQLRFKYLATSTNPGRWQIKNFSVKEGTHGVTADPTTATMGGAIGNSVNVTATSEYPLTYEITEGSGFSVTQDRNTFTITATGAGGASEAKKGTVRIKEVGHASYYADVEVRQSASGAESIVYTLDGTQTGGSSGYATESDITQSSKSWKVMGNTTLNPWRIGGNTLENVERTLYSTTAISEDISKIEIEHGTASSITVNSMTVIVASNSTFATVVDTMTPTFAANGVVTVNRPAGHEWKNCYYKIVYNVTVSGSTNKFIQFKNAKFTGK